MALEEKIVVILYNVCESGYLIEHDSPAIGAYQTHSPWRKTHGIYRSQNSAKKTQERVVAERLKEGYEHSKRGEGCLWRMNADLTICIQPIEVEKNRIAKDGYGNVYFEGQKIQDLDK